MNKITEKWKKTGLLDELPNEITCNMVAQRLEEVVQYLLSTIHDPPTPEEEQFAGMILPITRRVYETLGCSSTNLTAKWLFDDYKRFMEEKKDLLKDLMGGSYNAMDGEAEFAKLYCDGVLKRIQI